MPLPLIPLAVMALGGLAFHQTVKREKQGPGKGVVTAQRQNIFETAMRDIEDPAKLRQLAATFREQGLPAQADMLEKRAKLRELPEPVKKARRDAFRKAIKSTDPNAVRNVANAFEKQGAMGAAESLRQYAASLPIPVTGSPPPEPQPVQAAEPPQHAPEPEPAHIEESHDTPAAHGEESAETTEE